MREGNKKAKTTKNEKVTNSSRTVINITIGKIYTNLSKIQKLDARFYITNIRLFIF